MKQLIVMKQLIGRRFHSIVRMSKVGSSCFSAIINWYRRRMARIQWYYSLHPAAALLSIIFAKSCKHHQSFGTNWTVFYRHEYQWNPILVLHHRGQELYSTAWTYRTYCSLRGYWLTVFGSCRGTEHLELSRTRQCSAPVLCNPMEYCAVLTMHLYPLLDSMLLFIRLIQTWMQQAKGDARNDWR